MLRVKSGSRSLTSVTDKRSSSTELSGTSPLSCMCVCMCVGMCGVCACVGVGVGGGRIIASKLLTV